MSYVIYPKCNVPQEDNAVCATCAPGNLVLSNTELMDLKDILCKRPTGELKQMRELIQDILTTRAINAGG